MSKMILFTALLLTACTESTRDVSLSTGGYGGNSPGGGEVASTRHVDREVPVREIASRVHHRDADFVVCAQCRR
jgi:hypothetical protein